MRKLIIGLVMMMACSTIFASDSLVIDLNNKRVKLERIINLDTIGKNEIFTRSRLWAAEVFTKPERAITFESANDHVIIGRFRCTYTVNMVKHHFTNNFKIYIKDGKAKVILTDIYLDEPGQKQYTLEQYLLKNNGEIRRKLYPALVEDIEVVGNRFFDSYQKHILNPPNQNW